MNLLDQYSLAAVIILALALFGIIGIVKWLRRKNK